jgi:hypothetical protein
MFPGSPFLSECQALSAIWPGPPNWCQTGILSGSIEFLEIGRSHRVPNQGSAVSGGWQPFCISPETAGWGQKCKTGHCHGKAARSVLAKVRGDIFTHFHAVTAKRHSRTQNSKFGLLGLVLHVTTTAVKMAAPVRNILETTSYLNFLIHHAILHALQLFLLIMV